jgi:Tol biopolymer transport system component
MTSLAVRILLGGLAAVLLALLPAAAQGQPDPRPHLDWRTLRTEHFDVHYPEELAGWTREAVSRLEAVHGRVSTVVGNAPGARITLLVEDPANQSNASAWAALDRPSIVLWPTPPDPRSPSGHTRGWAEMLLVHEYTHLAHQSRPSRSPFRRFLWNLAPLRFGPVDLGSPRWITEGYATYVEGTLTGSGRPHGAFRAGVLRQWALEGKLPSYAELDGAGSFHQGRQAYLAGSAFVEWLVERKGDASMDRLWRRMSARQGRSFDEAFAGVFGGYPADLYARFTVDVTSRALAARERLARAGLVAGDTVQALQWDTGDPAVSPDGEHVAITLRSRSQPPRVVVWRTVEEPDTAAARAREAALRRDPQDVAAIEWRPPSRKPLATLDAFAGSAYSAPRFLPGGEELLVTRWVPRADGAVRPDLFVWSWKTGAVRRVTHGAAVRDGDPSPDGRTAAAVRCEHGQCGLVRVDLASGAVSTLAAGSFERVFHRPRWAPDGRSVVASMQEGGPWRLVRVDAAGGAPRVLGPLDGASRYDAAWTPGGALVAVSEAGGIANVVHLDPATGSERPLTRVTGAAYAPEPHPDGSIFFLDLSSRGHSLHRVHPHGAAPGATVALPAELYPAVPPPAAVPADTFARAPLPADRAYGLGPRQLRWAPGLALTSEGEAGTLALALTDPVGRFSALLQGAYGTEGTWRGAGLALAYRGMRPTLSADLFRAEQSASAQHGGFRPELDARYTGAAVALGRRWTTAAGFRSLRVGASAGALETPADDGGRRLVFGEAEWSTRRTSGASVLVAKMELRGSAGRTGGDDWTRGGVLLTAAAGSGTTGLRLEGSFGASGGDTPAWERFSVGGAPVTLFDAGLLPQRIPMPGLPVGTLVGDRMLAGRATLLLGGYAPFLWAASPDGGRSGWYRVLGIENTMAFPAVPLMGTPRASLTGGVLYPLDEPFRKQLRAYLAVGFRP